MGNKFLIVAGVVIALALGIADRLEEENVKVHHVTVVFTSTDSISNVDAK